MSNVFIILIGLLNIGSGVDLFIKGNTGMAIVMVCYGLANFGMLYAIYKGMAA